MSTIDFIDKFFHIIAEILIPALGAWGLFMMRAWLTQWMKDDEQ